MHLYASDNHSSFHDDDEEDSERCTISLRSKSGMSEFCSLKRQSSQVALKKVSTLPARSAQFEEADSDDFWRL